MYTYLSNESELVLSENTFYPPTNFTDKSVGGLTFNMNLSKITATDFSFSCVGSYTISNEYNYELYRLSGTKIFEIKLLDLKNPDISLLKDCVKKVHNSLKNIFDNTKIDTKMENWIFPLPTNDQALSSRIGLEILKFK